MYNMKTEMNLNANNTLLQYAAFISANLKQQSNSNAQFQKNNKYARLDTNKKKAKDTFTLTNNFGGSGGNVNATIDVTAFAADVAPAAGDDGADGLVMPNVNSEPSLSRATA